MPVNCLDFLADDLYSIAQRIRVVSVFHSSSEREREHIYARESYFFLIIHKPSLLEKNLEKKNHYILLPTIQNLEKVHEIRLGSEILLAPAWALVY